MANWFWTCGQGITDEEWNIYTNNIENVLDDPNGRSLYMCFLEKCNHKPGKSKGQICLEVRDMCNDLMKPAATSGDQTLAHQASELCKKLRKIECIDRKMMKNLKSAIKANNNEQIVSAITDIQHEITKEMEMTDYKKFQEDYFKIKNDCQNR